MLATTLPAGRQSETRRLLRRNGVSSPIGPACLANKGGMFMTSVARILAATFILVWILGLGAVGGARADVSVASPSVRSAIDAAVAKERDVYGGSTPVPGVLVGVWDNAGDSYVRAYGTADFATHRALTPADHFRIGSNTKTF